MEIKVLKNEGLYREYEVVLASAEAVAQAEKKLAEVAETYEMAGFRPGKVPLNIVRKRLYTDILSDSIKKQADTALNELLKKEGIVPAPTPSVELRVFDEKGSMTFFISMEVFPNVPEIDWSKLEIEELEINLDESDLKSAHNDILKNFRNYDKPQDDGYAAVENDAVMMNFVGTCEGEQFEGGSAENIRLVIGSKTFIPGFEEQLIGVKAGEEKQINVIIPENYPEAKIAGKPATFAVKVLEVLQPEDVADINDEFAQKLGLKDLEQLNSMILDKVRMDFHSIARLRMKKMLFDQVDEKYQFEVPESMVKIDFDAMWREIEAQFNRDASVFKGKTIEQLREEYLRVAARRVRVGIILANIARQNDISITEEDCKQAILMEAMRRPGQEQMIFDFYKKPENIERLKGPILEEKAVDFVITQVQTKKISVTSKEFFEKYAKDLGPDAA